MQRGQLGVGRDELGARWLRLEQGQRLGDRLFPARVAQPSEHGRERGQHPARGHALAPVSVERERLLERRLRLLRPPLLLRSLRPALEQQGALRMAGRGERECVRQALLGTVDLERQRPLARQGQVAERARLQHCRLPGLAGGAGERERAQVVVSEHIGQVLDPLARLLLQPRRRRFVAGGPGGARDLAVGNVPDEQVPEAVLALSLHRARPDWADELLVRQLV